MTKRVLPNASRLLWSAWITTRTIIRRFGGKAGLLNAAIDQIGDFILHLMEQEGRQLA